MLRAMGAKVGRRVLVYPTARVWAPWNLVLADGCVIGPGAECYNVDVIEVGAGAVISQRAYLCSATHDIDIGNFQLLSGRIVIGEEAWVAAEAFVGPGVTVGTGAVVGARAVATRDVLPWNVVAGNPARVVRVRGIRVASGD